jgi:hypothetical protein
MKKNTAPVAASSPVAVEDLAAVSGGVPALLIAAGAYLLADNDLRDDVVDFARGLIEGVETALK